MKATPEDIEACQTLAPFMRAGLAGLQRSRWRPSDNVGDLVAPIVLAVLVEVAKQLPLTEMTAALDQPEGA
jgi:hypothetical protein